MAFTAESFRHRASKPQGSSERVLPWQITMDQLIFASLSHTHYYWYEVGMLKVPAAWGAIVETLYDRRCNARLTLAYRRRLPLRPIHHHLQRLSWRGPPLQPEVPTRPRRPINGGARKNLISDTHLSLSCV